MIGISRIPSLFRIAAISDAGVGVPAWNLAGRLPRRRRAEAAAAAVSDPCSCALALAGHGEAYNEEAFQYLLSVERKRFERSNQPLFLMLVELDSQRGQASMDAPVAAKVFAGLGDLLRETDMIGWYREGRVVGALLTHHGDAPIANVSRLVSDRVTRTLRSHLPGHVADRLQVRLQPLES